MDKSLPASVVAMAGVFFAGQAVGDVSIYDCLRAASAIRAGEFAKVEYLGFTDEREAAYEIEIKPASGRSWEFECSARTGEILEIEQEVDSTSDPLFKSRMKISEDKAIEIATRLYPGTVEELEYEIEANGDATYEIDIIDADAIEFKVEVNATSGDITEVQIEQWEIGIEDKR